MPAGEDRPAIFRARPEGRAADAGGIGKPASCGRQARGVTKQGRKGPAAPSRTAAV
jgi:hypothetical protein